MNNKASTNKVIAAIMFMVCLGATAAYFIDVEKPKQSDQSVENNLYYKRIGVSPVHEETPDLPKKSLYTIEISSTKKKLKAQKAIEELKKSGVEAYYTPFQRKGVVYFRVRAGVFPNEKTAAESLAELKSKNITGQVMRL